MNRFRFDRRLGMLLGAIALLIFVALGATVALPATDEDLQGKPRDLSAAERDGMIVYRNEGCWYCHTRSVRSTPGDAALGEVLGPDAYAGESPVMLGAERIGPDLTHLGDDFADAKTLVTYLRDSRERSGHSSMPAYAYLSEDDLQALAAFLLADR